MQTRNSPMRQMNVILLSSFLLLMPSTWAEEPVPPAPQPAVPGELLTADEALTHLASNDPLEREQGLYQLGMLKSKAHVSRVLEAVQDPTRDVQRAAIVALRLILEQDAVPELERLVQTAKRYEVRGQALHELEALRAAKALPTVERAWKKDRHPEVRLAALEALGAMQDASVVPHLMRALKARDARMRRSAAIGLGHLGKLAEPAVPALIKRLKDDPDENVRVNAAEALYKIGDARAVKPFLAALNDRADRVRVPAFKALSAWAQPGMEPLLRPPLNYGRPHVRVYAAKLLSRIGTPEALELLKARLVRETHEDVKPALVDAVHALERRS